LSFTTTLHSFNLQRFEAYKIMSEEKFLVALGKRIKVARTEKKLKQNELACLCNFEKASMSRIESGQANPTVLTLFKISKALEVPMSTFFFEES